MASIYEINQELMELYDSYIDEETGEINEEVFEKLNALELEKTSKIENIACWIKNLTSDAEAIAKEAKKLTERANAAANKAESLKGYLKFILNGEKFSTDKCAVSFRRTERVECYIPKEEITTRLPEQFWKYGKPEIKKTEIKEYLKAGHELAGCEIVEDKSILIK